ncbi:glutathione S-transferase N-terminal domain-containing protein [Aidingimonas lacisalsi]|uniref:glutathione S-transferase N-terminal domain-containing protein n=1 Tax=Aidingimonas lacisalsi TaxID=2604086 RepID=UPI0011D1B01E|nr:glutathione S-transferase N-terminal domain-containing protein [Aidingimonas lacisalsi]
MELFLNATSPYARVVRIVVLEKGLSHAVTLRCCDPWADDAPLLAVNPVGRVPALVTDEGVTLSESSLIAQYLDSVGNGDSLLPPSRLSETLHLAGLGQGLMDAAFTTVIARKHQGNEADDTVLGRRRRRAIERTLDQLEREVDDTALPGATALGEIVVTVALDYLSFRLPDLDWSWSRSQLREWHDHVARRESFQRTAFM